MEISSTQSCREPILCYKMDANPCGLCLIINNVEFEHQSGLKIREGSNIDCDKLETRFKALNFIVEVRTNLKQKEIKHELSALSKKDHSQYDCCVVIMLSHGTEAIHNRFPGAVYGVDGHLVSVQEIINHLDGQQCPTLQCKPKLFFIQACGGGEKDIGFEVSAEDVEPFVGEKYGQADNCQSVLDRMQGRASLPNLSDIQVSYCTFPGYVAWRDPGSGSLYVEILDGILKNYAATESLNRILLRVNNKVSQCCPKGFYKQMPISFGTLRKEIFFQT